MSEIWDSNSSENWTHMWTVNDTKHDLYSDINVTYVNYYLHQPQVAAIFIISYFLIFFLCMVGNTVVCFIIMRNKHMHTVTNLFILNLAISDLLVGIFCMPITLLDNIIAGWPFGNTMCKISGLVQGISVAASVFTLVAIAVDRFRCVVYPFKPKLTIKTAFVIIVIIWVLAITIMSPSAVMLHVQEEKYYQVRLNSQGKTSPVYWCREDWPNQEMRKIYTTVLFANIYLAPLSLIVIMYGRIGISLFKTPVPHTGKQNQEQWRAVSKKKQKVIKMLLIVALLFILSWLPLWTLMMLSDYADLSPNELYVINIYIYPFAHWLAFCNSSVNPIIYGFFNENFHRGFQDAFQLQFCQMRAKPQEAFSRRARTNMAINTFNQLAQETTFQNAHGENVLYNKTAEKSKQELMMEDLGEASNNNEIKRELV
ncbi:neuropeptide FF receptor 2 [Elephas maximus indicus]|uniref:neuropeptide FF receptor 2 n=1 Tax=Elephas maximus indicus TaxID=99487 RepID=UPI00211646B3|nr:neuropeptide FF receptor 2 [Elephas maximus indicus]XP_049742005.1 neuropeptide FF receptor 2 [Elephas maximus indicus]